MAGFGIMAGGAVNTEHYPGGVYLRQPRMESDQPLRPSMLPATCAVIRTTLEQIALRAKERPKGYYEDVIARGRINGEWIEFDSATWEELKRKYRGEPPELPTLDVLARNFWRAVGWWIVNGMPVTWPWQFRARLRQCQTNQCGDWMGDRVIARCAACGCTGLKLWLASERCPKGFWKAVRGVPVAGWLRGAFRKVAGRGQKG